MELFGLVTLLFGAKLGGAAFKKFGQPSMAGELLAGLILGPYVLSLVAKSSLIDSMAEIGLVFLVLLISMSIDWRRTGVNKGVSSLVRRPAISSNSCGFNARGFSQNTFFPARSAATTCIP